MAVAERPERGERARLVERGERGERLAARVAVRQRVERRGTEWRDVGRRGAGSRGAGARFGEKLPEKLRDQRLARPAGALERAARDEPGERPGVAVAALHEVGTEREHAFEPRVDACRVTPGAAASSAATTSDAACRTRSVTSSAGTAADGAAGMNRVYARRVSFRTWKPGSPI